jgi:hypothetical protein
MVMNVMMNRLMNVNMNVEYVSRVVVIQTVNVMMNDVNVDYWNSLPDDNVRRLDDD